MLSSLLLAASTRNWLQQSFIRYSSRKPKCPPPTLDTGCTHCQTPFERDLSKPLALSQPYVDRYVIHLNHKYSTMADIPSRVVLPLLTTVRESPEVIQSTLGIIEGADHPTHDNEQMVVRFYPEGILARGTVEAISLYLKSESDINSLQVEEISKPLVMVCGHAARDARCGTIAPLLVEELTAVAKLQGLDFDVGYITHVGGHIYAGNLIIFKRGQLPTWYGRVDPHHIQGIIQESVLGNNIIDELYRGR